VKSERKECDAKVAPVERFAKKTQFQKWRIARPLTNGLGMKINMAKGKRFSFSSQLKDRLLR